MIKIIEIIMKYIHTIFIILFINLIHSIFLHSTLKVSNKLAAIRNKWKKFSKGKDKGQNILLEINELEYPRANETLRNFHEERWKDHYKCLKKRHSAGGIHKTLYPAAVVTMEGSSVLLNCEICISPSELHTIESIDWFYNSTTNSNLTNVAVDSDEYTIISPSDRSLHMFNIGVDKEGFYWCQLQDTLSNPYYIHVSNETELLKVVQGEEAPDAIHPEPPDVIEEYGLRVFTEWSTWSSCSRCDSVGRKQRYGYCTISLMNSEGNNDIRRRRNEEIEDTTDSDTDLASLIERVLIFFGNKLPCRCFYTPKKIQELPQVKNRMNEVMRRFCKVKCQDNVIFEIRDKSGNVMESANNSAGVYSMVQGLPDPLPPVQRATLYKKHDSKGVLKCPGNLDSDTPITWQIATKTVNPSSINQESNGRITIDSHDRLIFTKLRFADSNVYSCWQKGKLAGTIRLEVTYEVEVKADHRVMIIGAIAIVITLLIVFWRAFRGRKRYTKH